MIGMRLGNPKKANLFDRSPRTLHNQAGVKGISNQSSALKYQSFEFRKLGLFLTGDLIELETLGDIKTPGQNESQPCTLYFHVKSFNIKDLDYNVTGDIFIHSRFQGLRQNLAQLESEDCYVGVKNMRGTTKKMEDLKYDRTLRANDQNPVYSRLVYDEADPGNLVTMSNPEWLQLDQRLEVSKDKAVVQVPLNLHLDDASMVVTKMWKSASVVTIQVQITTH